MWSALSLVQWSERVICTVAMAVDSGLAPIKSFASSSQMWSCQSYFSIKRGKERRKREGAKRACSFECVSYGSSYSFSSSIFFFLRCNDRWSDHAVFLLRFPQFHLSLSRFVGLSSFFLMCYSVSVSFYQSCWLYWHCRTNQRLPKLRYSSLLPAFHPVLFPESLQHIEGAVLPALVTWRSTSTG